MAVYSYRVVTGSIYCPCGSKPRRVPWKCTAETAAPPPPTEVQPLEEVQVPPKPTRRDPFRIVPPRYLGYLFVMGELFKNAIPKNIRLLMNDIGSFYFVAHALYQGVSRRKRFFSISSSLDTLIFDGFASAILPGVLIYYIPRLVKLNLEGMQSAPPAVKKWGPEVVTVCLLVMMGPLIDGFVDVVLNRTVRHLELSSANATPIFRA